MKSWIVALIIIVAVFFLALGWLDGRREKSEHEAGVREQILKARIAEAETQVRHDSIAVVRTVTRNRTLRDTLLLNLTDTIAVKEFVYATDTLYDRCIRCTESAALYRVRADSSILFWQKRYENVRPRFRDRFGITVGYGVTKVGREAVVGPQAGLSIRVWP